MLALLAGCPPPPPGPDMAGEMGPAAGMLVDETFPEGWKLDTPQGRGGAQWIWSQQGCTSSRQAMGACFPFQGDGTVGDGSVPSCLLLERAAAACEVTVRPSPTMANIQMATLLFQVDQGESTPGCVRTVTFSTDGMMERRLYESGRDSRGLRGGYLYRSTAIWQVDKLSSWSMTFRLEAMGCRWQLARVKLAWTSLSGWERP
ncbi:MAG: hypothetical protein RMK29_08985 [Myxococcales bacterium]|nr:hypothetical protein [Myxococcales bacterium]